MTRRFALSAASIAWDEVRDYHGRAAAPPVLGVEVLGLGDVAGERREGTSAAVERGRRLLVQRLLDPTQHAPQRLWVGVREPHRQRSLHLHDHWVRCRCSGLGAIRRLFRMVGNARRSWHHRNLANSLECAVHGQDHCELVNPAFILPDEEDIRSGGCTDCSLGEFVDPIGVPVYARAKFGQSFERVIS